MNARLSTILYALDHTGYKLDDESVGIARAVDAALKSRYGDISLAVDQVRDDFAQLKAQLSENVLMTLRGEIGRLVREVDPEEAKEMQLFLTDEFNRKDFSDWFSEMEETQYRRLWDDENKKLRYISGGVKSPEGVQRRIKNPAFKDYQEIMADLTRGRIICNDLQEVVKVGQQLVRDGSGYLWFFNNYHSSPLTHVNGRDQFNFAYHATYLFYPLFPYELQVTTSRAHALGTLNHSILRRATVVLPDQEFNYMRAATWGAHLLDYEDYLEASK